MAALALLALFVALAWQGAVTAAAGQRVLGILDPVMAGLAFAGRWLTAAALEEKLWLAWGVSGLAGALALLWLLTGRLRALPLLPVVAGISLVALGQAELLAQRPEAGAALYLMGLGLVFLGSLLTRERPTVTAPASFSRNDLRWVVGLCVVGLLLRLWAVTELPPIFVGEMGVAMMATRTLAGIHRLLPETIQGTSIGSLHFLPQWLLFQWLGASVYTQRLLAVGFGTVMIPLLYGLLHRAGGRVAAIVGSVLLITAPEQLWWSRSENHYFILVCLSGVVMAGLVGWLFRTHRPLPGLLLLLWLPLSRLAYLAGVTLVALPWGAFLHALLFGPRRRRLVIPLLSIALGTALWVLALSGVHWLSYGQFVFRTPAQHGELVTRRNVDGRTASLVTALQMQAESVARNVTSVASSLTYRAGFTQWYQRVDRAPYVTWLNVAVTAWIAIGLAFLLGRIHQTEAALVVGWVVVGLLPAVLSSLPEDRRMAAAFPGMYAVAALAAAALLSEVKQRCGRWAWRITLAAGTAALSVTALASLASHLSFRTAELPLVIAQRAPAPVFRDSEAIYHDGDLAAFALVALGNSDSFLDRLPCVQDLKPREWRRAALENFCRFDHPVFHYLLPGPEVERLREAYRLPSRVSFVLSRTPASQPALKLLDEIFPYSGRSEVITGDESYDFHVRTVEAEELSDLRRPILELPASAPESATATARLLAGTEIDVAWREGKPSTAPGVLKGGVLVHEEDWYRIGFEPPCPGASLTIDGQAVDRALPRALLAGVHSWSLSLPDPAACPAPMTLHLVATVDAAHTIARAPLLAPGLAKLPLAAPQPSLSWPGYEDAGFWDFGPRRILDARPMGEDRIVVLVAEGDRLRIRRFSADEVEEASWEPAVKPGSVVRGMAVSLVGDVLLESDSGVWIFDPEGHPRAHWPRPEIRTADVVLLPGGRVLAPIPERASLEIIDLDGRAEELFSYLPDNAGRLQEPVTVALAESGEVAVGQTDGEILRFAEVFDPARRRLLGQFRMRFSYTSVLPRSLVYDGPDRLLAGDTDHLRVLVHRPDGPRWLATEASRDWGAILRRTGDMRRLLPTRRYLYVLAGEPGLRRFRRPESSPGVAEEVASPSLER